MPSKLKDNAWCPNCGLPLCIVFRTIKKKLFRVVGELEFVHTDIRALRCYKSGPPDVIDRIHAHLTRPPQQETSPKTQPSPRKFFGSPNSNAK